MFAMLHGKWPMAPLAPGSAGGGGVADAAGRAHVPDAAQARVAEAVRAQVAAGLELVTDGLVRWTDPARALRDALRSGDTGADGMLVRAWRAAASVPEAADATVAATITGPYSLALSGGPAAHGPAGGSVADAASLGSALAEELRALAEAGCRLVVVDEPAAVSIGGDEVARRRFREAQLALLGGSPGLHAMLAITGGSAWEAGAETILEAPYASHLFDLVAGPDNWYLVRATPGERGVVCAAFKPGSTEDQAPLLAWATRYAASSNGRGLARVGLANASSFGELAPEAAVRALEALARAARLAGMEPEEAIAAGLDVRTFRQPAGRGAKRGGLPRA